MTFDESDLAPSRATKLINAKPNPSIHPMTKQPGDRGRRRRVTSDWLQVNQGLCDHGGLQRGINRFGRSIACGEGFTLIIQSGGFRILAATEPVDFRKGMDGLAALIVNSFDLDLYDGAIWLVRSRRADRVKVIVWDDSGLILAMKRLRDSRFVFPMGSTLSAHSRPSALDRSCAEAVVRTCNAISRSCPVIDPRH